jgi:hypothetical protein
MTEADTARLLEFLEHHDAPCPVCGYNLRGLTAPRCPECDHALELTVGASGVRIGWFIATLAPFMSVGMGALALGTLLAIAEFSMAMGRNTGGGPPPMFHLITMLGLGSGLVAAALVWKRRRFLALSTTAQKRWALVAWLSHGLPFMALVILFVATL